MTYYLPRDAATTCSEALLDLERRLNEAPIRGWTPSDLSGDGGLGWLGHALQDALKASPDSQLLIGVNRSWKQPLLDRLSTLEMAAPGLGVEWTEGFLVLSRAMASAVEPPEVEEEEEAQEEEEPADAAEAADDAGQVEV